jgi:TRAP-type C4-dicarboxylate transport system substrate-binding protein
MRAKRLGILCPVLIAALALLALVVVRPGTAADPQYKLRIGTVTTKQNPVGQGAVRLAEVAEQQSKGRVKVDVFDAGQLGGELDMVSQIRLGSLDMAIIGSGIVASVEPTFSITELPFIWKSDDARGPGDALRHPAQDPGGVWRARARLCDDRRHALTI